MVQADLINNSYADYGGSAMIKLYPSGFSALLDIANQDALDEVNKLLTPILESADGEIINDCGEDVTLKYKGQLDDLFR